MYKSEPVTQEAKEKQKYRQSAQWKKFRFRLKKERKVDYITDKPLYKGFQVHHCDMSLKNYKDLNPDNFYTLSRTSHEFIHWIFRYSWESMLLRIAEILMKMDKLNYKEKTPEELKLDEQFQKLIDNQELIQTGQYQLEF